MNLALLGAGAAIAGGVLSGGFQLLLSWLTRPQLKLNFDPDIDKSEVEWGGDFPFNGVLVRVSLTNNGFRAAKNCSVFVTSLTTQHATGTTKTSFAGSRQLPWAGWTFKARALHKGIPFYVDLARVSKASSGWQFTFKERRASDKKLEEKTGIYRFHIVAVADNAKPTNLRVDIDYNGDWKNLRAFVPSK